MKNIIKIVFAILFTSIILAGCTSSNTLSNSIDDGSSIAQDNGAVETNSEVENAVSDLDTQIVDETDDVEIGELI